LKRLKEKKKNRPRRKGSGKRQGKGTKKKSKRKNQKKKNSSLACLLNSEPYNSNQNASIQGEEKKKNSVARAKCL
jgi:hypothetical protein